MKINRAQIRGVELQDIEYLGSFMHEKDKAELQCSYPEFSAKEAVALSVDTSLLAFTATWDNKPAVMFGVCPTEDRGIGRVWLLNDIRKEEYRKSFLKLSLEHIETLQSPFEYIFNYVWAEHKESLLWLTRLGFVKEIEVPNFNGYGELFYLMIRSKA